MNTVNKAINKYCFLKGTLIKDWPTTAGNPHYDLIIIDSKDNEYTININVRSKKGPSELKYWIERNNKNPIVNRCFELEEGLHSNLITGADGFCLDYLRADLMDINKFHALTIIPDDQVSELETLLSTQLQPIINNPDYYIGIWGMGYNNGCEKIIGIDDVHMNQGNSGSFLDENGIWQDGGLAVFDIKNKTVIFSAFFMFQVQCTKTDDEGNCLTS